MVHLDAIHHPTQTNIIRNQIRLLRFGQHIMATTRRPQRSSSRADEMIEWDAVCPLCPRKRTFGSAVVISALRQKQTFCAAEKNVVCWHGTFDETAKLRSQLV